MSTDDTRERILDAAENAFADGGLAGARVQAIAAEADVNKAMLYYYFGSKEDLYKAVLIRVFEQVSTLAAERLSGDAVDLEAFLKGYQAILEAHPAFVRIMVREMVNGGPYVVPVLGPRIGGILGGVASSLDAARRDGRLNPAVQTMLAPPVLVAPFVLFALASPVISAATGLPREALAEPYARTAREILLHGLLVAPPEEP